MNTLQPVGIALYTPDKMVDLMATRPDLTHLDLAAHFGRGNAWLASVMASEAFQVALDKRRHEIHNPAFTATLRERFAALAIQANDVMLQRMDGKGDDKASDLLVFKASEIAMKALGMGLNKKPDGVDAPKTPLQLSSEAMADKLVAAMERNNNLRTVDSEVLIKRDDV